jgi:hypothetical protein
MRSRWARGGCDQQAEDRRTEGEDEPPTITTAMSTRVASRRCHAHRIATSCYITQSGMGRP